MSPSVSVVIPVYNVAPYLQECVDSVLSQRFTDFEVLLVDDGSTDGSGAICDELAQKDPRVVVLHQENGGACSARNCGIDHARGEFLVFVDADDLVTEDYLQHLMDSDADIVVAGLQMFGASNGVSVSARRDDFGIGELARHWNEPPVMHLLLYCYPVAKRYKTRILAEMRIRFDESLFFSEDLHFNLRYYCYADSFTELPYADYLYRIINVTREEKFKMGAAELINHYEGLNGCFDRLYMRIGAGTLPLVRDNLNLRLIRKLYAFLMQEGISQKDFVRNAKLFRKKDWADYLVGLLPGKKERRVMREAVRFPVLAYWTENRLQRLVRKFVRR